MEKHAFYSCRCGADLYSTFPYKVLFCTCGLTVPRLFMVHKIPSMEDVGTCSPNIYKEFLLSNNIIAPTTHPYVDKEKSFRPYVLGMGCDGSTDLNIHFVLQKALLFLGFDDYRFYHDLAYPGEDNSFAGTDFSKCMDEAIKGKTVDELTLIPENASIGTLVQELEAINFRSLASVVEELFNENNIDIQAKLCDLLEVKKGILNGV